MIVGTGISGTVRNWRYMGGDWYRVELEIIRDGVRMEGVTAVTMKVKADPTNRHARIEPVNPKSQRACERCPYPAGHWVHQIGG